MKNLRVASWAPSVAFAALDFDLSPMKKYLHNCSDRRIFTSMCFDTENGTGRVADFQKSFRVR